MGADSLKTIIFALVLFSLFAFLIVYPIKMMGETYGVDAEGLGEGSLNDDSFYSSIENVSDSSDTFRQRFTEGGGVDDVDDVTGIFAVVTDTVTMITTPFRLLANILTNVLNIPTIAISIILGLLGLSIIFGVWRLLRAGD